LNAIHWLDRLPAVSSPIGFVYRRPHPIQPENVLSKELTAAFTRQAKQDLTCFLECRARELVPGAKLLLAAPGDTEQVRMCDGFYDVFNDSCLDLIAADRLDRTEYERITMPCYYRTVAEMLEPLEHANSPVRHAFAVDRAEAIEVPLPFLVEFQRSGDAVAYADAYTGFLRAVSEPVVKAALQRPEGNVQPVDCIYERIRARLLAQPERYSWRYILTAVLLTRR
jgi:cyclopropane-fatty-acyl-phospholipid synthase